MHDRPAQLARRALSRRLPTPSILSARAKARPEVAGAVAAGTEDEPAEVLHGAYTITRKPCGCPRESAIAQKESPLVVEGFRPRSGYGGRGLGPWTC
jgi:hypothetical protein